MDNHVHVAASFPGSLPFQCRVITELTVACKLSSTEGRENIRVLDKLSTSQVTSGGDTYNASFCKGL